MQETNWQHTSSITFLKTVITDKCSVPFFFFSILDSLVIDEHCNTELSFTKPFFSTGVFTYTIRCMCFVLNLFGRLSNNLRFYTLTYSTRLPFALLRADTVSPQVVLYYTGLGKTFIDFPF